MMFIKGFDSVENDLVLFCSCAVLLFFIQLLWSLLVFFIEPGTIDTRDDDFNFVLAQSEKLMNAPPSYFFCRTTMMRRPLRSKYSSSTNRLVARMDHFCKYLNNDVGFGNHRVFVAFLYVNFTGCLGFLVILVRLLNRAIGHPSDTCFVLSQLFGNQHLFFCVMTVMTILLMLLTFTLLVEQTHNIFNNLVRLSLYDFISLFTMS